MILDIFLPEQFQGKRLLSKKIVAFSLEESSAKMTELTLAPGKSTIHTIQEESIAPGSTEADRLENTIKALTALSAKMPSHDYVRVAISTQFILFKEVKLPLKNSEKIRLVIGYEIESLLPFPLSEAIYDFIVTRNRIDEDFTQVLVAAVRKQDLNSMLEMYNRANIFPTHVTVDLLAFYAMYHAVPEYSSLKDGSVLVDIGINSTRIAFLENGELRLIRTVPKGIDTLVSLIVQETKSDQATIIKRMSEQPIKSASGSDVIDKSLEKNLITFLNDIQFTLNSFSLKLNFFKAIQKIFFLNIEEQIKGFSEFASQVLQIPCEQFPLTKLFDAQHISLKVKPTLPWSYYSLLVGVALQPASTLEIDFLRGNLKTIDKNLYIKQLIAASLLIISIFTFILVSGFLQLRSLNSKVNEIEKREIAALKKSLTLGKKNTRDESLLRLIQKALSDTKLPPLLKKARSIVDDEDRSWSTLAGLKVNALSLLNALTAAMDKKLFSLKMTSISLESIMPEGERIIVSGFLKSRTEEHFQDYAKLKQHLSSNKDLILIDSDEGLGEEEGVKFTLTFKPKDRFDI